MAASRERTAEAIDVFPGALPQATATISSLHGHRMLTRRGTAEPPQPEGAAHAGTVWRSEPCCAPGMWGTQRPPQVPGGEGLVNTPTGRTAALAAPEASA